MWKVYFGVGTLQAYKFSFETSDGKIEEYIHCEVMEWVETGKYDKPIIIKVRQIRNLQEYFSGKRLAGPERLLKVADLEVVHFKF